MTEAECLMPLCADYVQELFKTTKTGNGQKWIMIEVRNKETMEDVLKLISLRRKLISIQGRQNDFMLW